MLFRFFIFFFIIFFSGIALAQNEQLLQKIVQRAIESESDSLVIMQKDKIIYSNYFKGSDKVYSVQSVTKSICAISIAILLDEGKISSLDLPMSTWIPSWAFDEQKSIITLRMIMNHTSGLPDIDTIPDFWSKPDTVLAAETTPLIKYPGSQYLYTNIGASLLQPVIEQASKQTVTTFVREKIFTPLEITDFQWKTDKIGHEVTSGGLFLSTSDMLKIGSLMLNQGSFEGRQIMNPSTMQVLITKSQPFFDYALLWWLYPTTGTEKLFSAKGWGGQYITVFPAKNLIAIRTKDPATIDSTKQSTQAFRDFCDLIYQWK